MLTTAEPALASRADLARALALYNDRQFDQAIEAAIAARKSPETQDAGAVVLARAHLERYREQVDPADLGAAREALGSVRTAVLEPRTRLEYLLALGQALFLEDEFGAAAALFASAVTPARELDPALGESFVDWWGSAVERQADVAGRQRAGWTSSPASPVTCAPSWAAAPNPRPPSTGWPPPCEGRANPRPRGMPPPRDGCGPGWPASAPPVCAPISTSWCCRA